MSENPKPADLKLLEFADAPARRRFEATVGTLVEHEDGRDPLVEFEALDGTVLRHRAASTVPVDGGVVGYPVMLMFLRGDPTQPVITGVMPAGSVRPKKVTRTKKLELDAKEVVLEADSELTLKCGKSSITLTKEGRIVLRGKDLVSRASSVNRIRGGVIQLN